ncbi:50S ribosomal protein L4 [Zunongwangia profunda]|jgi:large subunit ribosomal protein L4|uniref:50S ribosomal protein L4 n=1 Tax=Zunongwangia profunda TaxID=398743 RepID=UPI0023A89AA4|nr:50S ribosomal protein L4 [Zunongwangia profunda]MCS5616045.1 50S ribosomal protein L4 [Candidatus Neomarinimicrobiota bacterium]MEE3149486.1 50S ribosomal protein L4 [Candidatus Neomarinimicrobiota bacterium]|tara:strand:- start:65 stop:694 length:630 start_codon:yes stop_codon:yes gene_type:complete
MELQVVKSNGKKASKIMVDASVFNVKPSADAVNRAILSEMENSRQGTHGSKSRGMVRGGGKKPWKQKGRGVARAGTTRSPLWRGGGTVFGPQPHQYEYKLPKKIKRLARRSILSEKLRNKEIIVLNEFSIDEPKTKKTKDLLFNLDVQEKKILILTGNLTENLVLSMRNIPNIALLDAMMASAYDLLDSEIILIDQKGLEMLNDGLADK